MEQPIDNTSIDQFEDCRPESQPIKIIGTIQTNMELPKKALPEIIHVKERTASHLATGIVFAFIVYHFFLFLFVATHMFLHSSLDVQLLFESAKDIFTFPLGVVLGYYFSEKTHSSSVNQ